MVPSDVREIVVFVASPGDVPDERSAVRRAADHVNTSVGSTFAIRLRVTGWEETPPEAGRPQELINPLVDECDVFVGLLNRRWGTPTGTHTSGFEEEFERALARRSSGPLPRIGVFFKTIPAEVLSDPGVQVSKVISFRRRLDEERVVLYGNFDNSESLELALVKYFMRVVAEHAVDVRAAGPRGTADSLPAMPAEEVAEKANMLPALVQLGQTLSAFKDLVQKAEASDYLDSDRMILFSHAVQPDAGLLPVHSANRLYARREELQLVRAEADIWIHTVLADVDSAGARHADRVIPGWAILAAAGDVNKFAARVAEHVREANAAVSGGAFLTLQRIGARPALLWGAVGESSGGPGGEIALVSGEADSPFQVWVEILADAARSSSALRYLASVAKADDADLLKALCVALGDGETSVSVTAIREAVDGDSERMAELVEGRYKPEDWQVDLLLRNIDGLTDETLTKLVLGKSGGALVREASFRELAARGSWSADVLYVLVKDEYSVSPDLVFDLVSRDRSVEAVKALIDSWVQLEDGPWKSEIRIRAMSIALQPEDLRGRVEDLWANLDEWRALAWAAPVEVVDAARAILDDREGSLIAAVARFPQPDELRGVAAHIYDEAASSALRVLRLLPLEQREPEDVVRARRELERQKWGTKVEASRTLAVIGTADDADLLISSSENMWPIEVARNARKSAFIAGGVDFARKNLASEDSDTVTAAAEFMAASDEVAAPEFSSLLSNGNPQVRMIALDAIAARIDLPALADVLKEYLGRETYYYNVVAGLDSKLYTPEPLASSRLSGE